jgi:hypothetical protein
VASSRSRPVGADPEIGKDDRLPLRIPIAGAGAGAVTLASSLGLSCRTLAFRVGAAAEALRPLSSSHPFSCLCRSDNGPVALEPVDDTRWRSSARALLALRQPKDPQSGAAQHSTAQHSTARQQEGFSLSLMQCHLASSTGAIRCKSGIMCWLIGGCSILLSKLLVQSLVLLLDRVHCLLTSTLRCGGGQNMVQVSTRQHPHYSTAHTQIDTADCRAA